MKKFLTGLLLVFILTACNTPTPSPTATLVFPTLPITQTPLPNITATTASDELATPQPETQANPNLALTTVKTINMRSGPSTTFKIVDSFAQNTEVAIIGKAQGNDWLLVETSTNQIGWMSRYLLDFETSLEDLTLIPIHYAHILHGTVEDLTGAPISLVTIQAKQTNTSNPLVAEADTDESGQYWIYLPKSVTGTFNLTISKIDCESRIADGSCQVQGAFEEDGKKSITVPVTEVFDFIYRP